MALWEKQSVAAGATAASVDQGLRSHMLKVYNYMASATLLTGLISYFAGTSPAFLSMMLSIDASGAVTGMSGLGWLIVLSPVALVMLIGLKARTMSSGALQAAFWGYAVLMGLSLFSIFAVYTGESIARVFFISAGTFGLLSMYGYTTNKDLTSWGSFLFVGVLAMFFVSIANVLFFKSSGLSMVMSYIGVLLALGLTAYDTQKVKEAYYLNAGSEEGVKKASVLGALTLYFDFIYLFVHLLRIMGERR